MKVKDCKESWKNRPPQCRLLNLCPYHLEIHNLSSACSLDQTGDSKIGKRLDKFAGFTL